MDESLLAELLEHAQANHYGVVFLWVYGATWVICGLLWLWLSERTASLVTLLQGVIALPVSIALTGLTAAPEPGPLDPAIAQFSGYAGGAQVLALPFLVYLVLSRRYSLVPYAFASVVALHFVSYSWLYQTIWYLVMGIAIAIGTTFLARLGDRLGRGNVPMQVSVCTGVMMFLAAVVITSTT